MEPLAFLPMFGEAWRESAALLLGDFSTEGERERFAAGLGEAELLLDPEGDAELFLAATEEADFLAASDLLVLRPVDLRCPALESST